MPASRTGFIVVLTVLVAALVIGSPVLHAAARPDAPAAAFQGTCGDGLCDAYIGENTSTCPADCAPSPVPTKTSTPIPSATPTATATPTRIPTRVPTRTPTPTPTLTRTPPPTVTPTATATATRVPPSPSPTPVPPVGCGFLPFESRTKAWRDAYRALANPAYLTPVRSDNQEVYVCDEPPTGRLCFPEYDGLLQAAGNVNRIRLIDCSQGGECHVLDVVPILADGEVCFDLGAASGASCVDGCALLLPKPSGLLGGLPPAVLIIPVACVAVLAILVLILLIRRRRRSGDQDEAAPDERDELQGG